MKRKFGENCVSRSVKGLEAEGYPRIWIYDYLNQRAKMEVKSPELKENWKEIRRKAHSKGDWKLIVQQSTLDAIT